VARHLDTVWRVLRRSGLEPADAEDAAQDVFWVFAQKQEAVPEPAERSFLISTALRVASDRKRAKWSRAVSASGDLDDRILDGPSPDEALDTWRARQLLDQALRSLSDSDRAVFVLVELEQMTRSEASAALGIPEGTVASRLRRAREAVEAAVAHLSAIRKETT